MLTFIIFIAVLALLVLVHEAGHFFVARRAGVRVDEFGFGFPPRLFKVGTKAGTVYSINIIPLGGFVKIKGEEGQDKEDVDSFAHKKPWVRSLILSAGVFMNVALAAVLLSVGFMIGIPAVIGDDLPTGARITNQEVGVIEVLPDSPAAKAGIQGGDAIARVNDELVANQEDAFTKISSAAAQGVVRIEVKRGKEIKTFALEPIVIPEVGRPAIGVGLVDMGLVHLPWYRAIPEGIIATGMFLWDILRSFGALVAGAFRGAPIADQLSGPVGIAVMTGQAARLGISYLLQTTALLSLNLALVNALPIPALDGGRLLFVAIEKLRRGKAVSKNAERWMHTIGLALLLLLVIAVTAKDIGRLF